MKKLILNVRKTAPLNKTFECLMPDLQINSSSVTSKLNNKLSESGLLNFAGEEKKNPARPSFLQQAAKIKFFAILYIYCQEQFLINLKEFFKKYFNAREGD